MSDQPTGATPGGPRDDVIAQLRKAIGAVESTSADMVIAPAAPRVQARTSTVSYPGMPEGDDWIHHVPPRYHDGEHGFDRRLMEDLAAVGVPCYTVSDLTKTRTVPQGIPVFIDWLTHLDERIPGAETNHRRALRADLIRNLNDPAARGNKQAIDLLITQLKRRPALEDGVLEYACSALNTIATPLHFPEISPLLDTDLPDSARSWLITYLGKVKTRDAQNLVVGKLHPPFTVVALQALTKMKATGVRGLIEPLVEDENKSVRKHAQRALERLSE